MESTLHNAFCRFEKQRLEKLNEGIREINIPFSTLDNLVTAINRQAWDGPSLCQLLQRCIHLEAKGKRRLWSAPASTPMSGALHLQCRSAFSVLLAEQTLLFFVDQARNQLWSRWEGCSGDGEPKTVSQPYCPHLKTTKSLHNWHA